MATMTKGDKTAARQQLLTYFDTKNIGIMTIAQYKAQPDAPFRYHNIRKVLGNWGSWLARAKVEEPVLYANAVSIV